MMSSLLKLDNYVDFLMNDWVELRQICRLDTALCCKTQRQLFIHHFRSLNRNTILENDNVRQYFHQRLLECDLLCNLNLNNLKLVVPNLSAFEPQLLTNLHFNHCADVSISKLQNVLMECTKLKNVTLINSKYVNDGIIYTIAAYSPNLLSCNLVGTTYISDYPIVSLSRNCVHLVEVNLSRCSMITDVSVVQLLINCLNLKSLNLSHCEKLVSVTGILRQIKAHPKLLSKLLTLSLSGCALPNRNKEVDTLLGLCTALTALDISQVGDKDNIGDSTLTTLACCCPDLTSLDISGPSAVSDEGVTTLSNACRLLTRIDLSHLPHISLKSVMEVTNKLDALCSVKCVQSDGGFSNDNALRVLSSKFDSIVSLDVQAVKVEGVAASHRPQQFVFHFSDVEQSGSFHANSVLDCSVALLIAKCVTIHTFVANERTTTATLHSLISTAENQLTSLDVLQMASVVADSDLIHLAACCSALIDLCLADCAGLTDEGLSSVLMRNNRITSLNCSGCVLLTDSVLDVVSAQCVGLQRLNLDGCIKLTNGGVSSVAKTCTALTSVSLQNCSKLTDKSITVLMAQCEFLAELNVSGCRVSKTCQGVVDARFS